MKANFFKIDIFTLMKIPISKRTVPFRNFQNMFILVSDQKIMSQKTLCLAVEHLDELIKPFGFCAYPATTCRIKIHIGILSTGKVGYKFYVAVSMFFFQFSIS